MESNNKKKKKNSKNQSDQLSIKQRETDPREKEQCAQKTKLLPGQKDLTELQ